MDFYLQHSKYYGEKDYKKITSRIENQTHQGSSGSEIWFRDFRSLSRKGSRVPPDRLGLLGAFLSGSPGNGPDLVRVHAKIFLCASHSAMTRGAQ